MEGPATMDIERKLFSYTLDKMSAVLQATIPPKRRPVHVMYPPSLSLFFFSFFQKYKATKQKEQSVIFKTNSKIPPSPPIFSP